jgi:hypothetical protein
MTTGNQFLGRVTIRANGRILNSKTGASINLGGIKRNPQKSDTRMGFSEEMMESTVDCEMLLGVGDTIDDLRNFTDGTVTFECDTGQQYVCTNSYVVDPLSIKGGDGGAVPIQFKGNPAEEMGS